VLPPVRRRPRNPLADRHRPGLIAVAARPVAGPVQALQPITFQQVRRSPEEPLFNSLLEQFHYLRYTQPVGAHRKYLVWAHGQPIACFTWSSAPRHLASRDRFIGWSPATRRQHLHLIAYNSRYLVLPWVRVPGLASHLLSRMVPVLVRDWQHTYGAPLWWLETFIDPTRHRGTCYRAANWIVLGRTTGRGHNARSKRPTRSVKEVLGYPLTRNFRARLGVAQ
jgi:hypothetical protein